MSKETFTFSLIGAAIPLSQFILAKELLVAFQGFEISLGIALGISLCWMAVGSLGLSGLGKGEKGTYRVLIISQILLSLLMPVTLVTARLARHLAVTPDISSILHICIVITAILSLLQGFQLNLAFRFSTGGLLWGLMMGALILEPAIHYLHPFWIIIPLGTLCLTSSLLLLSKLLHPPPVEVQAPARTYRPGETLTSLREKLHRKTTFNAQYPQTPFAYHRFLFPKIDYQQPSRAGHTVYYRHRFSLLPIVVLFLTLLAVYLLLSKAPDRLQILSRYWQWGQENIIDSRNSSYGHLAVTSIEGRHKLHLSGQEILTIGEEDLSGLIKLPFLISDFVPTSWVPGISDFSFPTSPFASSISPSAIRHPQSEDPPSAFRPLHSKRVCLIGGQGLGEILNYPVEGVDYVGLDPLMADILLEYTPPEKRDAFFDPRVSLRGEEGRRFIEGGLREEESQRLMEGSRGKYDVILLTAPYPSTLRFNRFYTKEFFASLSGILEEDGLFFLEYGIKSSAIRNHGYPRSGCEIKTFRLLLGATLGDVFSGVIFVQQKEGSQGFLCSNSANILSLSSMEIAARAKEAGLDIAQIQPYPIPTELPPRINRDLSPAVLGFKADKLLMLTLLLILLYLGLTLWFRKPDSSDRGEKRYVGLISGFGGWAVVVILILSLQALYGHVYHRLGVIVAAFLIGFRIGMKGFRFGAPPGGSSSFEARGDRSGCAIRHQKLAQRMLGLYLLFLPLILMGISTLGGNLVLAEIVFPGLAVLAGFLSSRSLNMPEITEGARRRLLTGYYLLGAGLAALVICLLFLPLGAGKTSLLSAFFFLVSLFLRGCLKSVTSYLL
ncbi:MAG: hypothetical protein AB1797_09610 [bacterium]